MYFYKAYGLTIYSEIKLPELADGREDASCDLEIRLSKIELPVVRNTNIYRRGVRAAFGIDAFNNSYLAWPTIANFKASHGKQLLIEPLSGDGHVLSLFTVSEALGLILFQRGHLLLHASAVQVGEEAWCFMGVPGAGKSTTAAAFIKSGCKLLSDDLTAIDFDKDGKVYVIPAYPQLKIWDKTVNGLHFDKADLHPVSEGVTKFSFQPKLNFSHEPVALGKFFFMHKARNRSALRKLRSPEIATQLLKNFPLPIELLSNETLKTHFLQSFQCARSVEMWHKRRPDGFHLLEKWVEACVSLETMAD